MTEAPEADTARERVMRYARLRGGRFGRRTSPLVVINNAGANARGPSRLRASGTVAGMEVRMPLCICS